MAKGGAREGAGRPKGIPTQQLRVPVGLLSLIKDLIKRFKGMNCSFYSINDNSMESVETGILSVPEGCQVCFSDNLGRELDGRVVLVKNKVTNGYLTRRLKRDVSCDWLTANNPEYPPIALTDDWEIIATAEFVGIEL